jgi:6-phosphofructokinase 1
MNTALYALTKLAARRGVETVGFEAGYEGLMANRRVPLKPRDVDAISNLGGTILGSARSERFRSVEGRAQAAKSLSDLDALIVIGGNGSLAGARRLGEESGACVVGIPASIDNDIACTSNAIGVDTALNTIVGACDRISDTARAHRRVFIVEVMGRDCGYLAMASSVASGADACLYRESGRSDAERVQALKDVISRGLDPARGKQRILIIKAEGVQLGTQALCDTLQSYVDQELSGVSVRGTVLGHLVRGGNPSYQDRALAGRMAFQALDLALAGTSNVMLGWQPWDTTGGTATPEAAVWHFPLSLVESRTASLLDGCHPTSKRRVQMMESIAGVLAV